MQRLPTNAAVPRAKRPMDACEAGASLHKLICPRSMSIAPCGGGSWIARHCKEKRDRLGMLPHARRHAAPQAPLYAFGTVCAPLQLSSSGMHFRNIRSDADQDGLKDLARQLGLSERIPLESLIIEPNGSLRLGRLPQLASTPCLSDTQRAKLRQDGAARPKKYEMTTVRSVGPNGMILESSGRPNVLEQISQPEKVVGSASRSKSTGFLS